MQRLPEMHIFDGELSGRTSAAGDGFTCLVLNRDANLRVSLGIDDISYPRVLSIYPRRHGIIADVGFRSCVEFDGALDACIVEKVKFRGLRHDFSPAWNVFC